MPLLSFFDPCTYPSTSLRMTARQYPPFGEVQEGDIELQKTMSHLF